MVDTILADVRVRGGRKTFKFALCLSCSTCLRKCICNRFILACWNLTKDLTIFHESTYPKTSSFSFSHLTLKYQLSHCIGERGGVA